MKPKFVIATVDVHCRWHGEPPRYRCYVENELFAERTWLWDNVYLEESFQIEAPPGKYKIRYELVDKDSAELKLKNARVDSGPAVMHKGDILEILDENA